MKHLARVSGPWKWRGLAAVSLGAAAAFAVVIASASGGTAAVRGVDVGTPGTARLVATVDVADLPPPTAQQTKTLPFLVRDPAAFAAAKAASSAPAAGSSETSSPEARPSLTPGTQLSGAINFNNSICGCTPPDMALGVDTSGNKMQQVNMAGRVWDGNNNPGAIFSLASFYATGNDFISDPWVFFDAASQRWFAGIVDVTKGSERLAVSTSSTPSTFNVYDVSQGGGGACGDQAKIGVSDNVVAMSSNIFTNNCNGGYAGVRLTVLNKSELVAGNSTIDTAAFGPLSQYFSLVPAQSMSSTTDQWYAQVNSGTTSRVVRTTGTPPGTVTRTEVYAVSIKQVTQPPDAQQPGTGTLLATNDNRVDNVVWESNRLIYANSTGCVPANDTTTRSCARLISVDTTTGGKIIDKNWAKSGQYFFFPAVQVDPAGTISLAYGRSSSSVFPELDARPSDPSGVWGARKTLVTGTAANTTHRYGDYFAEAIDPSNTTNVWIAGEIGGGTWSTAIREATLAP
jgi:hypothetical protein